MSVLEDALAFHGRGWLPLPIPTGKKKPGIEGWQKLRPTEADLPRYFNNNQNIGLLLGAPSNGLTDIDLDWPEARLLAPEFLPQTKRISGRKGSLRSHYWFITNPIIRTKKFVDPLLRGSDERAMIVEIRSTGTQTIAPPSIHPSGEQYTWHEAGEPAEVNCDLLQKAVDRLAACALATRYWQEGKRHDLALALSGVLLRAGWSIEDAEHFIIAAARAANDDDTEDRRRAVRATFERLTKGEPATGFPRLSELFPKEIASRIMKWLRLSSESHIIRDGVKDGNGPEECKVKASRATLLVELAFDADLFHTPNGEAFARVPVNGHCENWQFRSKAFRRWLSLRFFEKYKTTPGAQAIQDALAVLEGMAQFNAPEKTLYTRIGEQDGAVYLDLANESWQAVEITGKGWRITDAPPIFFRRSIGMLPLPQPLPGGSVENLREFINIASRDDWALLSAWLIGALRPQGPYPVLVLHGEHGAAKSTASRVLRSLVDPNTVALRSEPRDARDLMITAKNGWVIALDNLSNIPVWLSDALCRLATGGGFATRELFTDSDEVLFNAQRPVLINGIEELATRNDLLDRSVVTYLPAISEEKRRSESEFWSGFEKERPLILGALLDAVSSALRNLNAVQLDRLPRLADFALWVAAAESAMGLEKNQFINAYAKNREETNSLALDSSVVATAIVSMIDTVGLWSGTATELLSELGTQVDDETKKQPGWPRRGNALSNKLRRLAPNLRAVGITISFDREGKKRSRIISIEKQCKRSFTSSAESRLSENKSYQVGAVRTDEDNNEREADDQGTIP
jgi:hypothetical protein